MEIKTFPSPNLRSKIQQRRETNVVVVGGGLSSAQIVDMAVRKGVTKVWFLMRSEYKGRWSNLLSLHILKSIANVRDY
jgi:cation diffusion facilitator CzcD-associated flavoprotein CzcO